jgi:tetratricopeptide (TPR) repeat protein
MKPDRADYDRLVESLADGVPLDWAALSAKAATPSDERRYRNLRLVARIAELHRTIALEEDAHEPAAAVVADGTVPPLTAWGHLHIVKQLAVGSFGELYLAHDPQLNRDVALKLLRRGVSNSPSTSRLLTEAQTIAKVRHPNVVTIHGADVREGRAGLWMELVNGRTLETFLLDNGALGAGETMSIGRDLCRALAAVHAAGLIHGDVKAQNVMREEGGRIVLMDFGSGQAQGAPAATAGTPLYLAPEVLAGAPATTESDIYSLGVLLFHLLTNRYPCYAADIDALRAAHAQGARLRLRDLRPDLDAHVVDVVERALEPDPAMRFATAGAMEQALAGEKPGPRWRALAAAAVLVGIGVALVSFRGVIWGPKVRSLAVTPFAAAGADSAHLLSGLSGDVVRELQRFDLEVKGAPASAGADPAVVERRVGTEAVLQGSSSAADGRATLRVAVVRAGASELWSKSYPLDSGTLPSLARTISQEAAAALRVPVRKGAPAPGRQATYAAYDAYQRGRALWEQRDPSLLGRSLEYFKQAAKLDPEYAQPWAGMADAYIAMGVPAFGTLTPLETRRLAKNAALKAIELDPNLVEAHTSLAFTAFLHDWDWTVAERRFQQALALNPQYPLAHHWYAEFLNEMGRFDEAMAEIRRAQALDPMSVLIHRDIGWHLFCQRRYDEAIAQLRETLTLDPGYSAARTLLARALAAKGEYAEALAELARVRGNLSPTTYLSFKGYIEAASGDRQAAAASLQELHRLASLSYVSPYYLALIHTALGEKGEALAALERSHAEQDSTLVTVNIDPRFDPLRGEARFKALIARMHFPGAR